MTFCNVTVKKPFITEAEAKYILSLSEAKQKSEHLDSMLLRLVFIGRNDKVKGLHVLRKALSQMNRPVHLTLVGDLDLGRRDFHDLDCVGVIDSKEKLMTLIDKSHALVVPSLSEGMPTVILEAMARGKAIIASDVGAVSELVDDSNGKLVPPNDAQELANAIKNLGDTDIKKASEQSLEKVASFTWDEISNRFLTEMISY